MGARVFLVCWALAATVALMLGRDANLDLRQYHLHNAWALLEGRWSVDLAPAGLHSFLHPGLDLPFYLLTRSPLNDWPRVVAILQAGYGGLLAFLVLRVTNLLCNGDAGRLTAASVLVAGLGLTGAATLPEAGVTKNDLPIACFVVGALLALLLSPRHDDAGHPSRSARLRLLAGVLGGAAVGLKLTAVIFPPALALAAVVTAPPPASPRLRAVALLAIGGLAGFALVYGPWGWFLWERFGNPFGPFFNEVFRSPWFPPSTPRDTRFLPETLGKALVYPVLWAGPWQQPGAHSIAERPMRDPRFALGLGALLLVVALNLRHRHFQFPGGPRPQRLERTTIGILAFIAAAYIVWLTAYSYLRYAVPIEVLLGIPVWLAARGLLSHSRSEPNMEALRHRGATLCVAAVLATCALVTEYPRWDREPFFWPEEPRGAAVVAAVPVSLPDGSLVVIVGNYVSFLAPSLHGPGLRFAGVSRWAAGADPYYTDDWSADAGVGPWRVGAEVRRLLHDHPGPVFVLLEDPDPSPTGEDYFGLDPQLVRAFDVGFDRASCRRVLNNLTRLGFLCQQRGGLGR